jgi:rubrerythrin
MEILDFAMQMEKDGEEFYRGLAGDCPDKGLKAIFTMMAEAEAEHYRTLAQIKEGATPPAEEDTLLDGIRNIFVDMGSKGGTFNFSDSQIDVYKKALDIEKRAEQFFLDKLGEATDEKQRTLLKSLADEERDHVRIIENILEFVSRPSEWLENAEWSGLEIE